MRELTAGGTGAIEWGVHDGEESDDSGSQSDQTKDDVVKEQYLNKDDDFEEDIEDDESWMIQNNTHYLRTLLYKSIEDDVI